VYRAFEDVADFREVLDRLEHDTATEGQLPLIDDEPPPIKSRKR
jgi:transcriptional repressor NrdR